MNPTKRALAVLGCLVCVAAAQGASAAIAVTTYHYDALRTGWNKSETVLTASSFPANFGVLRTVTLDDQVDAQPLLVPAETIAGGVHDVLYVVTAVRGTVPNYMRPGRPGKPRAKVPICP